MAKFKVGDKVWFKAPVTGVKVTAKITATLGGEKYGFVDDDGIQGTIEGNAIYPLNSRACNSRNPIVANAMNACGTARNADAAASQKLRNEWHNAFQSMKRLYDAAKSEGHKAIMDAANAATKVLMDKTQSLGFS